MYACAISDGATVVVTGGAPARDTVSRYTRNGWIEDLPSLIEGRQNHGCASFAKNENLVRNSIFYCIS